MFFLGGVAGLGSSWAVKRAESGCGLGINQLDLQHRLGPQPLIDTLRYHFPLQYTFSIHAGL